MDTFFVQLITAISLFLGNIVFGSLPIIITKIFENTGRIEQSSTRRQKTATFLLYFGGGVFISNIFLVLLPQARKLLKSENRSTLEVNEDPAGQYHDDFPIPEFVNVCCFFATYVLQEIIHYILYKLNSTSRKSSDLRVRFCTCAKRHTECSRTYKDARPDQTLYGQLMESEPTLMQSGNVTCSTAAITIGTPEITTNVPSDLLRSSIISQTVPNYGTLTNITEPATDSPLPVLSPPVLLAEDRRLEEQHTALRNQNQLIVSSMLTSISLFLQFLFLGITIGLQATYQIKWYYLLVFCFQICILTFSASSEFATHCMEFTYVAMNIFLLAIISPIGLLMAMIKSDSVAEIPPIAKGFVAAAACGMLMYTTFYEILKPKYSGSIIGLTKFLSVISGASLMAALQYASSFL